MELQSWRDYTTKNQVYEIRIPDADFVALPLTPEQKHVMEQPGPISHKLLCLAGIARILEAETIRQEGVRPILIG